MKQELVKCAIGGIGLLIGIMLLVHMPTDPVAGFVGGGLIVMSYSIGVIDWKGR